ncbi:hypothetical protein GCM10010244_12290 [Streptomyces coeruleorubidus]|nr:hypothetical protein GCM10010244_12290 [Streptomyces bellus]
MSPSAAYVRFLVAGLLSAGASDLEAVATYVAACPGAADHWSTSSIIDLLHEDTWDRSALDRKIPRECPVTRSRGCGGQRSLNLNR